MQNTQVETIIEIIEQTQNLAKWYFKKLNDVDIHKNHEVNGQHLNSVYWLAGHLAWAEDMLLVRSTGAKGHGAAWLKKFELGSNHAIENGPDYEEVKAVAKEIHGMAMEALSGLSDSDLQKENALGMGFGGDNSLKTICYHAIRHLGSHVGHLGWLCKINAIKTA